MKASLISSEENIHFFLNKWVYCKILFYEGPDLSINLLHLVHEKDLKKVPHMVGLGILHCEAIEGNYLVLKNRSAVYRVMPSAIYMVLPNPDFVFSDYVQEVVRPEVRGLIYDIIWHGKDEEYKYYIVSKGSRKSRRYSPSELQKIIRTEYLI